MTIRDVAFTAKVSIGTVSNLLNNPSVVTPSTRARVLRAIDETGFVRNTAAKQLRGGKSGIVGVVLLDIANPFFTDIVKGAERVLRDNGYTLMLCSSDESLDRELRYLRVLEEHRVDGLLITPVGRDLRYITGLAQRGIPTVLLDRDATDSALCSVTVDDIHGAELAIRHVLELGHRSICFLNGPVSIRQCADRREGVRKGMRSHRPPDAVLRQLGVPSLTSEFGERASMDILSTRPRPTATVCANDLLALGVLRGLSAANVAVPHDMAVVGYDDVEFASMLSPPLTSVRQPTLELGAAAAHLLLDEKRGSSHQHRSVRFQPELVVRHSTTAREP